MTPAMPPDSAAHAIVDEADNFASPLLFCSAFEK